MKLSLILALLFVSIQGYAQQKNPSLDSVKSSSKTERISNGNNFENGTSPTTYRYFFPEVSENGYSPVVYKTEGMDNISYFGNRLVDRNLDGRIEIIQRIKEFISGDWDFPSTEPRAFIRNEIDKDFNSKLYRDTTLLFTSADHKYHEDESGAYFYNFAWFDPTFVNEIGIDNWKDFFSKNGLIENVDYGMGSAGDRGLGIEFMPRIYRKKNGIIKDVTSTHLRFSERILATRARFPWDQSLGLGDLDGDSDTDILMSGIHASVTELSGLPDYDPRNRSIFYYFKNDGSGKLFGEIYDFDVEGGYNWLVPESTNQYATQMDNDPSEELLSELWIDIVGDQNSVPIRKFGHFNLNHTNKRVVFNPIFSAKDYLLDTTWNIFPKHYLPMSFLNPQKELIFYFFTGPSGSPSKEFTGVNLDNSTGSDFTKGVVQQYFRMYEKIREGNNYKLVDVTKDYFFEGEYETFSLDNSGTIHLIDVDNDGKLDIYPQIGSVPYTVMGGINQFLKYPAWNGKTNTLYYFKQVENNKFKLTDLAKINGFYYPNNLESGYSVFNSNGIHKNGEKEFRLEEFTLQNNASLNDIDGDGIYEIISAANPDYLYAFTKSSLPIDKFENLLIDPKLKLSLNNSNSEGSLKYDFSVANFSSDSLFFPLDESIKQQFVIFDSKRRMKTLPNFLDAYPINSTFNIEPNLILSDILNDYQSNEYPMGFGRWSPFGKEVNKKYRGAYYVRIDNDFAIRKKDFFLTDKNVAPLPFKELVSKITENLALKGFEVEISNSFDINQNFHFKNGQRQQGLKYGYEIYLGDSLLKRELFSNVNYQTYENGAKTKIYGLNILTGDLDLEKIDYKIFALDSFDESIKTYGTMLDRKGPSLITKSNITARLDDKGSYELKIEQVNNGSTDNVGITQMTLSKTSFTCSDLGVNKITFIAKDAAGNTSTAEVTVSVVDEIKPILKAKATYSLRLDTEGKAALKWEDLDEGSSDNCSIKEKLLSKTNFTCADLGTNKITFTTKDAAGNTSSAEVTVTVVDEIKPTLKAKAAYTINLDAEGKAALKWEDLDEGSSDNCSIKEKLLSKTNFTCADLGTSKVTFTAKDASGNTSAAEVTVTVVDEIKPLAKVKSGYVIKLDVEGKATLKWEDIDDSSTDNCSIKERKLSKTDFTRTDGGDNKITYTITDASGNTSSIETTVRVDIVLSAPERTNQGNSIKAYPNPVNDYLYLEFAEGISTSAIRGSSLVDASGRVLGEIGLEEGAAGQLGFSTRDLKQGMYFLRLSTRDTLHLIKFNVIH
ncbi:MAG: hypothetical protein NBV61_05830 [Algoriphagus sp.]|nr:hypothetical protein [Algoriphagus sp.]